MRKNEKAARQAKVCRPVCIGDFVRAVVQTSGELYARWVRSVKSVSRVRGNVVYVDNEDRPYHAWQVKVVDIGLGGDIKR